MRECQIDEELLSRLEMGELEEAKAAELRDHVQSCPRCGDILDGYRSLSALCDALPTPTLTDEAADRLLTEVRARLAAPTAEPPPPPPEIMTMDEVAALLQVTPDELDLEMDSLPVFEFAGRLRVRRARLLEWIEERESQARNRRIFTIVGEKDWA